MNVILREDVAGIGRRGDIVTVAKGHARNFLLPRGMAIVATPGAVEQAEKMRNARDAREAADREAARNLVETLTSKAVTVKAKAGKEGRLFGSVTTSDIATAISAQVGVAIDRKAITGDPIRTTGSHTVSVRLHADIECSVKISVVAA